MQRIRIVISVLVVFAFTSCEKDKAFQPGGCNTIISYSSDIVPIIQGSCMTGLGPGTGCHDAWITDYSNIVKTIENDSWPNAVWGSYSMPKIPNNFGIDSLDVNEVEIMRCWVEQGYPNN